MPQDKGQQAFLQMIDEFREGIDFKPIDRDGPIETFRISVCVRKRPLNKVRIEWGVCD